MARSLSSDVMEHVTTCRISKTLCKKYGHLPEKYINDKFWKDVCFDLIGPYTITDATGKEFTLNAMTMADSATGWF